MSIANQRLLIETEIQEKFTIAYPNVPLTWENITFNPPENEPWVRVSIQSANEEAVCIGSSPGYHTDGLAIFQIFTPLSDGTLIASQIADELVTICKKANIKPVYFTEYSVSNVGDNSGSNGWYQTNIIAYYKANYK